MKKKINKTYINIFAISILFLIAIIYFITFVLTLGDLNSPIIIDIDQDLSGVYDNVVVVDDRNRDYFYYKGLNYTKSDDGLLPSGSNQNIYPDSKLVDTTVIYNSTDLNTSFKGYVSLTELQDEYQYKKFFPVNDNGTSSVYTDDYIVIELIENPFTNRPTNKVFNGWYTTFTGVDLTYDNDYYIRYAKVPITYSEGYPEVLEIEFNASWINSASVLLSSYTWTTVFNAINAKQMTVINTFFEEYIPYDMAGYFHQILIPRNSSQAGYYNASGVVQSGTCRTTGGCLLYQLITTEPFNPLSTYYELLGGVMTLVNNGTIPPPTYNSYYLNDFNANYNMAGFYRQVTIANGNSIAGYYNLYGVTQSGNCSTGGGCVVYELIDYYDSLGTPELIDTDITYYYMVTRDTNIIVLNTIQSTTWSTSGNKPFTFTSVHNGIDYRSSGVYWNVASLVVKAYNDLNIENMFIRTTTGVNNTAPASGTTNQRFLYGNWYNVRIGRGITRNTNYVNFSTVLGGGNNSIGSSGNVRKYRLIIESGRYSTFSLANGSTTTSTTNYIEAKGIYGNDYDRATLNNTNLTLYHCASGSWGGLVYGSSSIAKIFDLTVKSGDFGYGRYDYTTGIYVGGRGGGTHYAARAVKVEGGVIYNLIGGPLTASNRGNYNDSYISMVGGTVDVIIGGAGTTATYGHRLLQITGGLVNYSIFGGSNGYQGSGSDGTVIGSSFVYVGGNAVIGSTYNVTNNITIYGAESGSVFGIGNGLSTSSTIGSSSNSNIIIDESATINRNVYGGGNYGAVGISSGSTTTETNITIINGTIEGSVYGGGNNNGSGNSTVTATINIETLGGEIGGSLYGGSNNLGTIYGAVNLDIIGGTFNDSIYGGGKGGYQTVSAYGTYVRDDITINVGDIDSIPIITNNLYGGSAFGSVHTTSQTPTLSSKAINVNIDNIQIAGSVFGGCKGLSGYTPRVAGNINVIFNDGTIPNLYGGNDISGTILGNSTIYLNDGSVTNVYGGGNQVQANTTNIFLQGSTTENIFGGSNQSGNVIETNITLSSGEATNIFGGNNAGGTTTASNIIVNGGTVVTVYGGNNIGGETTTSNITVNGGTITSVYGGGNLATTGTTNITLNGATIPTVYGGGESANITTSTNVTLNGSVLTNLYGGSNQNGTVPISNIEIVSGSATTVYGGNNVGGSTTNTFVDLNGGTVVTVYGGGNLVASNRTNIDLNTNSTVTTVYGGGENADVNTDTTITLNGGATTNIFGGSNYSGTVDLSNITVVNGSVTNIYGGNNAGGTTVATNITINNGNIQNIYGGGNQADSTTATVNINNSSNQITSVYGGGNAASVVTSTLNIDGGSILTAFGGSNQSGTVTTSNLNVSNNPSITFLYGGNNMGGQTVNSNITTTGGTIGDIFGGGNQAEISGNTNISITGTDVINEIYGGGKDGVVNGNTSLRVTDSVVGESVYAGGKGSTATVLGNTTLYMDGDNDIGMHVFGGGNAAATGTELANNSIGSVNITGGTIGGNVYGGANTAILYGETTLNIGYGLGTPGLINSDINIGGTVFGGGEANASGSEEYDFSFISVTNGITINIKEDATNTIVIEGSIFGSGNASSTTGPSYINIDNYGTVNEHKRNVSIQRADTVTMSNSVVELFGATDRTNEYSNVLFSISRVNELKLKNNSIIYMENGTNLLKKLSSLVDIDSNEVKGEVTIESGVVTKNVDNRVYALESENINIAENESVTTYGEVTGMAFFGMYSRDGGGNVDEAFYSPSYDQGDTVLPGEFYMFSSGSYVLGLHAINHNIEVDGFYSNYESEEIEGTIDVRYITPTPESSNYYMWVIGETISSYDIELIASKYSTLGAYELSLINSSSPNTMFTILGVNTTDLATGFDLVDKNEIPRIAKDGKADTKMGLEMRSSNTGWITVGETAYYTDEFNPIEGTVDYQKENSSVVPTLLFSLYHSKNLATEGLIGTLTISLLAITPIDELTNDVQRLNINITLSRALFSSNEYEGAMTPGEEHNLFVSTATNITNKSKLSAYYALYVESGTTIYGSGYHRAIVSSYVLPENTKLTMIDLTTDTPTYYYYEVSAADVITATQEFLLHNEASYNLSRFIKMGSSSTSNNFDDAAQNLIYYNNGIASEEFIFIADFADTIFSSDQTGNTMLIELRDSGNQTIKGVLGINYESLTYDLYNDKDAVIELDANLSKSNIYIKETTELNLSTNFIQQVVGSKTVIDTSFFYNKLGIKITIYDSNENILNSSSLLGLTYTFNGVTYYPRMDGTTRINISPRIANVYSKIYVNTTNSNLPSGTYKIVVESFGSPDGIYYGLASSDSVELYLTILNNIYGLSTTLPDSSTIIDSLTGNATNGNNGLVINIDYESGLQNPNIRLSLKRRKYTEIYSLEYESVNISDYITHSYNAIGDPAKYEYLITDSPLPNQIIFLYMKTNLVTGTYKITISLYDGTKYIGEVYNYIVIR